MKITIAGTPGSGKSTVAQELAKKLEFNKFSAGDFMRNLAKEKGITPLELSRQAEQEREIDGKIDRWVEATGEADDNFVMEGRIAFNFIPDSVKIFLDVSDDEAARRIFHEKRAEEKENTTQAATFENIRKRKESEKKRYKEYYGIDCTDPDNYDLVIDTTGIPVEKVVDQILEFLEKEYPEG
ncbi:nucleoside monophosphate kinase [Candidatus Woesearchaeota archaeon]|nr:nucleoside monophosphate kinase [Candidatus Woesearchaeota archaeon]